MKRIKYCYGTLLLINLFIVFGLFESNSMALPFNGTGPGMLPGAQINKFDLLPDTFYYRAPKIKKPYYEIDISPCFLAPISDFRKVLGFGFGAAFSFSRTNIFIYNLKLGFETGICYFSGRYKRDNQAAIITKVDSSMIIPVLFKAGYQFSIFRKIELAPVIGFGYCFNMLFFSREGEFDFDKGEFNIEKRLKQQFEPIISLGLNAALCFWNRVDILLGSNYNVILEKDKKMQFLSFTLGAGFKL